jgi:hypothetical protein
VLPEEVKSELVVGVLHVTAEAVIDDDGRFVGGDKVATDLILQLLDMPAAQRSVQVRALALEDPEYKRAEPDQFFRLREGVRSYELAINRMMRGQCTLNGSGRCLS